MYPEEVCEARDAKLQEIQEAAQRTIMETNRAIGDEALTKAWISGWQACLEAQDQPGIVIPGRVTREKIAEALDVVHEGTSDSIRSIGVYVEAIMRLINKK